MAETDSFEFNFSWAGSKPKDVAVDVSADRSGAEQPCFVDRRQEAVADPGQGVGRSGARSSKASSAVGGSVFASTTTFLDSFPVQPKSS